MANYGRLGPAGALRYCRSVSIDFEEEPSTQETEQREQALLQKLGFYAVSYTHLTLPTKRIV